MRFNMQMVRSALFNLVFYAWTIFMCIAGLPLFLTPRKWTVMGAALWIAGSLLLLRLICGIRTDIRGREHILQQNAIYASKHQSAWDTMIFWLLLKSPAFVLKQELLLLPLFGQYLIKVGNIAIDRSAGLKAMKKMLREAKERIARGQVLVIFPEGTRTAPGHTSPYQSGVAALYSQLNVPVVPVALNSGQHWGRNAFMKTPGIITISFLPPIQPGINSKAFMEMLQTQIEAESLKLLA